jgi:hypothetical protein
MNRSLSLPRTRSILGPLLLIAGGTLWLLSAYGGLASENFWAVLRFWPLLLIALGVDALLRWRWPVLANLVDLVVVALAVAAVIFAPRLGLSTTGGWMSWMPFMMGGRPASGHVITEDRVVADFDAVTFSSFGDLIIQPGERPSLSIEAEDDILRTLRTEVRNGTLYIESVQPGGWGGLRPTRPIRFTVTVVDLTAVELSGAGNIWVNGLATDRLQARLSGTGSLSLSDLQAQALVTNLSGAGSLKASGTTDRLDTVMSGVGSFDGGALQSGSAEVTVSGTGSATVWATDRLHATVSGVGSIAYFGRPDVTKVVSGLGNIRALGDK